MEETMNLSRRDLAAAGAFALGAANLLASAPAQAEAADETGVALAGQGETGAAVLRPDELRPLQRKGRE